MKELAILGTGSYTLPLSSNKDLLAYLESPKDAAWVEIKTGIVSHSLNFDCKTGKKITQEHAIDYAERAAHKAITRAGIAPSSIDHLCLATCTPSQLHFSADVIELHRRLGLRRDCIIDQIDGGCAALAKAFQVVEAYQYVADTSDRHHALIVATNDVASFIDRYRYRADRTPLDDAWISPLIFADGAGAVLLGPGEGHALVSTYAAVDGSRPLVRYEGGGAALPSTSFSLEQHAYIMDARDVAVQFMPAMQRVLDAFFSKNNGAMYGIGRWYVHQANLRFLEQLSLRYGISMDKIPHNIDRYGNTVSASTLILLDEDMQNEHFPKDDPMMFMFVGAGMMEGGALFAK